MHVLLARGSQVQIVAVRSKTGAYLPPVQRCAERKAVRARALTWSDNPPYNFVAAKRSTANDTSRISGRAVLKTLALYGNARVAGQNRDFSSAAREARKDINTLQLRDVEAALTSICARRYTILRIVSGKYFTPRRK